MKTCYADLIGRFGNQLFIYAHCRAWCEQNGYELITGPWVGERLFEIMPTRRLRPEDCNEVKRGYFQDQKSLIYTRDEAREWFTFRKSVKANFVGAPDAVLAHRRVGDYPGTGFVVVSELSYLNAASRFKYDNIVWITEENPTVWPAFGDGLSFVPDFVRLMRCSVLFRGNSTFSWWAATLGDARVFSPVIDGLAGGREQDCEFVEGNHPKMCNLDFVTDLHFKV